MLILHSFYLSLATYRVRIALRLKRIAFQERAHDLVKGEQHSPEFRRLNPAGAVPALEGGTREPLTQSLAILEWLEESYPNPPLLPSDAEGRARVRSLFLLTRLGIGAGAEGGRGVPGIGQEISESTCAEHHAIRTWWLTGMLAGSAISRLQPTYLGRQVLRLRRANLIAVIVVAVATTLAPLSRARADEGGVPFWLSGQFPSLAAVPATPGASVVLMPYYYNGSADRSKSSYRGGSLTSGLEAQAPLLFVQPGYASEGKMLGGQPFVSLAFGGGRSSAQADIVVAGTSLITQRSVSDSTTGGSDLYPFVSLAWNSGADNWMTYLTGDIPVGAYNSERLANIGIGHGAIDAGGGYTYLNEKSGRELSAVLGFTYNWKNSATDYKNGVDMHLDWAASQFLSEQWQVGVVGYVYQQLTADRYSTEGIAGELRAQALGSFKSRVASAGPEVGYVFKVGDKQAYANVRAYWEFWAQNRTEGYAVFATVSLPLGK